MVRRQRRQSATAETLSITTTSLTTSARQLRARALPRMPVVMHGQLPITDFIKRQRERGQQAHFITPSIFKIRPRPAAHKALLSRVISSATLQTRKPGTYTLTGAGTGAKFVGIQFNGITLGTVSNINSNTVASVSLTGVTSNGTGTSSPFMGIFVNNGLANTNSNTIGSQSATGSLTSQLPRQHQPM